MMKMPVNSDINYPQHVRREIETNDPPIEIGAIWSCLTQHGEKLRRIRILARYPGSLEDWIVEDLPAKLKLDAFRITRYPEFNLRYVFRPDE
jgi:hypothetical protein